MRAISRASAVSVVHVVGKRVGRAKEGVTESHDRIKYVAPAFNGLRTTPVIIQFDGRATVFEFVIEGVFKQSAEGIYLLGV